MTIKQAMAKQLPCQSMGIFAAKIFTSKEAAVMHTKELSTEELQLAE